MLKVPNIMQKVGIIFGTFRKKPYLCIRNKKQTLFIKTGEPPETKRAIEL